MTFVIVGISAGSMLGLALLMSYILSWANQKFYIEVDPRVEAVIEILPGANCGGCGFVGCNEYAIAIAAENAPVNRCPVGGENCAAKIADVMGVEVGASLPFRPIVHCGAHFSDRLMRTDYRGEQRCAAANLVANVQGCTFGCLGFGDCARMCEYDAIHVVDGLATVDYDKCIGCGACAKACPRNIITITPFHSNRILAVTCTNKDKGKDAKAVCKVGCIGCTACSRQSDLITMKDNLSTIDYDNYTPDKLADLLKAQEKCPRKRILFVGKSEDKDAPDDIPLKAVEADFKTTVDDTEWRG